MAKLLRLLSEGGGTRTHDLGIKSPLLYQLSYAPELAAECPCCNIPSHSFNSNLSNLAGEATAD